jgi:hypothetical protein
VSPCRRGAARNWSSCPLRLDRIWHRLGPLCHRHGVKGAPWKVKAGKGREKRTRARRRSRKENARARGEEKRARLVRGRREGKTSPVLHVSAVCTGWPHHACRSPLHACALLCSSALHPPLLCSAPSPAAVHSSLLPAVRDSRLVEIQIPAFQVLLCASMLNGSC